MIAAAVILIMIALFFSWLAHKLTDDSIWDKVSKEGGYNDKTRKSAYYTYLIIAIALFAISAVLIVLG